MNAALLMMTSTLMAGADAPAAVAPAPAPAVVAGTGCGSGCSGGYAYGPVAGGCCDTCGSGRVGLLDRLKGRFGGKHKGGDCCAAPAPCTTCYTPPPAPVCNTCAPTCCDSGYAARPNLFDRLKGLCKKKSHDCCAAAPACGGCDSCAAAPGAAPVPAPADTPKEMPKVEPRKPATPKVSGTGAEAGTVPQITIPTPGAVVVPSSPVTPVSGPKLTGSTSPY